LVVYRNLILSFIFVGDDFTLFNFFRLCGHLN
jgi:hypothetical protein